MWRGHNRHLPRGEERVDTRAGEVIDLVWCADIGDFRHLEVEDCNAHEGRHDCGVNLCPESMYRSNVHIVSL